MTVGRLAVVLLCGFAALLGLRLLGLYAELTEEIPAVDRTLDDSVKPLRLPDLDKIDPVATMFDVFPQTTPGASQTQQQPETAGAGLNELETGDNIIRVQGIFHTEDQQYVVISIASKKQRTADQVVRLSIGDSAAGYEVSSIRRDAVGLQGPSGQNAMLRIFRNEEL